MSIEAGASCVYTSRVRARYRVPICIPSAPVAKDRASVDLLFEGIKEVTADVTDGASLVSHGSVWRG
jgi:hypothetical protein